MGPSKNKKAKANMDGDRASDGSKASAATRDPPPHKDADGSAQNNDSTEPPYPSLDPVELSTELRDVGQPMQFPDKSKYSLYDNFSTNSIAGLTRPADYDKKSENLKKRAEEAVEMGYKEFKRETLNHYAMLTRTMKRKREIRDALIIIDGAFQKFSVICDENRKVVAAAPHQTLVQAVTRYLASLLKKLKPKMIEKGHPLPSLPIWGSSNQYAEWRTINDFEIFAASYIAEADYFLLCICRFLEESLDSSSDSEPHTPLFNTGSISQMPGRIRSQRYTRFSRDPKSQPAYEDTASNALINLMSGNGAGKKYLSPSESSGSEEEVDRLTDYGRTPRKPSSGRNSHRRRTSGDPGDGSSDPSSDSSAGGNRGPRLPIFKPSRPKPSTKTSSSTARPYHFDTKLKAELVPTWDGNTDELTRWIEKINTISQRSSEVFDELGKIVPTRLTGSAETWYYGNLPHRRERLEQNWSTIRDAIGKYYMNHQWLERQKIRANEARYRDTGNTRETPADYVLRKLDLIRMVYNYSETEMIRLIMRESPSSWTTIIQPQFLRTLSAFQNAVKYHEEQLMEASRGHNSSYNSSRANYNNQRYNYPTARVNLVGASPNLDPPQYPKDDTNVSVGRTPESKGARPCRHCGSGKHWDRECKHSRKGERQARVNLARLTEDDLRAQDEYDDAYYDEDF